MSMKPSRGLYQSCDLPNRETEFRVCVSIHEARNLEGVACNPLLRVACKCGQQVKKTKSVKGSINPKFNEVRIILSYAYSLVEDKK